MRIGSLRAYGWHDLADELRPEYLIEETEDDHTYQGRYFWPSEARDQVLARLLVLNAERHAEEVADDLAPTARGDCLGRLTRCRALRQGGNERG